MMWHIQLLLAQLSPAQAINLSFALVCVMAALGLPPRWVALLSAALYVALVCI